MSNFEDQLRIWNARGNDRFVIAWPENQRLPLIGVTILNRLGAAERVWLDPVQICDLIAWFNEPGGIGRVLRDNFNVGGHLDAQTKEA